MRTNNSKQIITILGALGGQGGSVVDSFLADDTFHVRGVTSQVDSDASKALQARGVEMVYGNVKEPETLATAFQGSNLAFVVVNFWDAEILTREGTLTKEILRVAKRAGVKHVIYSSLANAEQVSGGTIEVPHFTLKAQAYDYLQGLGFETVTAVEPAAYYSNWFTFFKPTQEKDGTLVWTWPGKKNTPVSQYDVKSGTGPAVLAAAKDPATFHNRFVLLEADKLTPEQIVAMISKKLGKPARINYPDPDDFSKLFDGAHEIAEMVRWFGEYGYYGPETKARKHSSGKKIDNGDYLISFQEWLDAGEYKNFME